MEIQEIYLDLQFNLAAKELEENRPVPERIIKNIAEVILGGGGVEDVLSQLQKPTEEQS
jgi:hypothetical protein